MGFFPLMPPNGINADNSSFAAPGVWEEGSNMRPWLDMMQTIGGWTQVTAGVDINGVCRNLHAWESSGLTNIACGTHTRLEVLKNGTLYNITPAGLGAGNEDGSSDGSGYGSGTYGSGSYGDASSSYYPRTWSFSNYGSNLIGNPRGATIYEWTGNTAVVAAAVTNAPAIVTFALVTQYRQLLALGCNEEVSGTFNAMCIRGSDVENITDWTTGFADNSFEHILEGSGRIVAGTEVGPFLLVWTDRALHIGRAILQPGQAYRFDIVADHCGLVGPNAWAVLNQNLFWIGMDYQFRHWSPDTNMVSVVPCPIHREFITYLNQAAIDKIIGGSVSQYGEVKFWYPDTRDGDEPSRYLAYSMIEKCWYKGEQARTAYIDSGATPYPISATYGGSLYAEETGETADGSSLSWSITSSDAYIDESRRDMMLRGVRPDFEVQGSDVSLTVYTRNRPQASRTTKGPYTLAEGATKKDFRASGALLAYKYSGTGFTRLGKSVFDVIQGGTRN